MPIDFSVEERTAVVVLNRPDALNAVDQEMREQLNRIWQRVVTDDEIWVVILTGAGERAFCTGADLKKTMPPEESFAQSSFGRFTDESLTSRLDTEKPLICAINGYALGGGLELALACDIRIASANAEFGLPEVTVGSIPGAGGTQRLPRLVGESVAMRMLLTGDRISADEALRIGLVSEVVQPEELMSRATAVAQRVAANAPLAVRAVKRMVRIGLDGPLATGLITERLAWGALRDTEDRFEGRLAFQQERTPTYRGR